MKALSMTVLALGLAAGASAAPNVTNATQKGSLIIFPDIRVDDGWNTLIRLQNDGNQDVSVQCYWMDGNKNRLDFLFELTRDQAFWFDARTGNGTLQVNPFPSSLANGLDNPFLITPPAATEAADGNGPYRKGLLACWAVDAGATNQVKWNHLAGTATLYNAALGAYEYDAYGFFAPLGIDMQPIGTAGTLNLNGVEYDSCPQYQIGQFSPIQPFVPPPVPPLPPGALPIALNRLAIVGCTLNLQQDYIPVYTKLQFDVWNEEEVKFTGAFECADSWHETEFGELASPSSGGAIDSGAQNFVWSTLQTYSARYRVQGVASTQCAQSQNVGVIGVQSSLRDLGFNAASAIYDAPIGPTPGNVASVGFQATQASELGDLIAFSVGSPRVLQSATVVMSSWGCGTSGAWNTNNCVTTPGATFSHPITLNLYQVGPGATLGALIATVTQTFAIPFRPSADPVNCVGANAGKWFSVADNTCYNGLATRITFDLTGVTVPNQIIWGVAYNTSTYGYAPIGTGTACFVAGNPGCGYDSLNVGTQDLAPVPTVGTDLDVTSIFYNSATAGQYCDAGAGGTGTFRNDIGCWAGFRPLIQFVAAPFTKAFGTTLAAAGRFNGRIQWDPEGTVPEGGIR